MKQGAMLNVYPDSMGGKLADIVCWLKEPAMRKAFGSIYILPSLFNSDLDRGFSIISYDLDEELASTADIEALRAMGMDVTLDFVLNHISVLSAQFQDILKKGEASEWKDFFINWNSFWQAHGKMTEDGYIQPDPDCVEHMFFRKPSLPLLMVPFPDGYSVPYWNTFYKQVTYEHITAQDILESLPIQYHTAVRLADDINRVLSAGQQIAQIPLCTKEPFRGAIERMIQAKARYLGQMDLNVHSDRVWGYYRKTIETLARYGAKLIRLDAFAYVSKVPGKRNFFNEPETWEILDRIQKIAQEHDVQVIPEIHEAYQTACYEKIARKGYMEYDFFLPGLILDALEKADGTYLTAWVNELVHKQIRTVNMLGCHDGIPLLDLKGLLPDERIESLIQLVVERGGLIKNLHGKRDIYYQVNATYYSALGENDLKLLAARAIQLFTPGIPQVWYLDLFAGKNDLDAVKRAGESGHKEINRTNLTHDQIRQAMKRQVVRKQLELLALRAENPAFLEGARVEASLNGMTCYHVQWSNHGTSAMLEVDLSTAEFSICLMNDAGEWTMAEEFRLSVSND